jgi:uncharacterized protein YndB with AHSA1/START domain
MRAEFVAKASIDINAPADRVWDALVNPVAIRKYMFDTTVKTDWKKGSPITWSGEWKGKSYEDKGTILDIEPEQRLSYSHFSPLTGEPDVPESYHNVTVTLTRRSGTTHLELTQDNNKNAEEQQHAADNWRQMLGALRDFVEKQ